MSPALTCQKISRATTLYRILNFAGKVPRLIDWMHIEYFWYVNGIWKRTSLPPQHSSSSNIAQAHSDYAISIFSDHICPVIGPVCIFQCPKDQVSPTADFGNAMARIHYNDCVRFKKSYRTRSSWRSTCREFKR